MVDTNLHAQLLNEMEQLPLIQQRQVVEFARSLREPRRLGVPGKMLRPVAGIMPDEDAAELTRIIEEGCEQIDEESWK